MLQRLDTAHMNRLRVADYLNDLSPTAFHMNFCNMCICGHINQKFLGRDPNIFPDWGDNRRAAADFLGIDVIQADELFAPGPLIYNGDRTPDPRDAARVMRYLAATDSVDWSVGHRD